MEDLAEIEGRFGKFDVNAEFTKEEQVLDCLFDNFKLLKVDRTAKQHLNIFVFICESNLFEQVVKGEAIPEYQVWLTTINNVLIMDKVSKI